MKQNHEVHYSFQFNDVIFSINFGKKKSENINNIVKLKIFHLNCKPVITTKYSLLTLLANNREQNSYIKGFMIL